MKINLKMKKLFISYFLVCFAILIQSQSRKIGLKKFLSPEKQLVLPTTAGNFTKKLGFEPNTRDDPNSKRGFIFSWVIDEEVEVTFAELKGEDQYIGLSCYTNDEIAGLPYDFVFNKTTFDDANQRFKKLNPKWYQIAEDDNNYIKLYFKDKNRFVYLYFYGENKILRVITVSTRDLE